MERETDVKVSVILPSSPVCVCLDSSSPSPWLVLDAREDPRGEGGGGETSLAETTAP